MTFVGIDPACLTELGRVLGRRADTIEWAASRAMDPLTRLGRESAADRVGSRLSTTVRYLRGSADDLKWRIDAALNDDALSWFRPISFSARPAVLATAVPIGAGPPNGFVSIAPAALFGLLERTPEEVTEYFATQGAETISLLAAAFPATIGAMDGAPPWARYAANDLLIAGRIAELRREAARVRDRLAEEDSAWFIAVPLEARLEDVTREIAELELWLAEDRQILLFDPRGDGRVAEVFGDLESARDIGIVVPGITNDRSNFSDGDGGFRSGARNVYERSHELGIGDVATVAWLGYDTPDGADAVLRSAADAGHDDLIDFVAGMDALAGPRHITVVGHSYGSLVTGMAAGAGLAANEVVFIGSPGTSLDHADDARLKPGGSVWAGLASGDPIGAGIRVTDWVTPRQQIRKALRGLLDLLDGESAMRDLHHGTNPAHQDFGAIEIDTNGSSGHSEYFEKDTVTLDNLLYIIAGMDAKVSIEIPDVIEIAPGPLGEPDTPVTVTA